MRISQGGYSFGLWPDGIKNHRPKERYLLSNKKMLYPMIEKATGRGVTETYPLLARLIFRGVVYR